MHFTWVYPWPKSPEVAIGAKVTVFQYKVQESFNTVLIVKSLHWCTVTYWAFIKVLILSAWICPWGCQEQTQRRLGFPTPTLSSQKICKNTLISPFLALIFHFNINWFWFLLFLKMLLTAFWVLAKWSKGMNDQDLPNQLLRRNQLINSLNSNFVKGFHLSNLGSSILIQLDWDIWLLTRELQEVFGSCAAVSLTLLFIATFDP